VRFLIDECLTVELVREAEKAGFEAHHVAHLGKASTKDWVIRNYAIEGDFVLVTNNASDFQALYAATDLHPGFAILVPNVVLDKQALLFRAALEKDFTIWRHDQQSTWGGYFRRRNYARAL
jgi:predicted nuclease of predicted toxin-antitoxin system